MVDGGRNQGPGKEGVRRVFILKHYRRVLPRQIGLRVLVFPFPGASRVPSQVCPV